VLLCGRSVKKNAHGSLPAASANAVIIATYNHIHLHIIREFGNEETGTRKQRQRDRDAQRQINRLTPGRPTVGSALSADVE